MNGTFMFGHDRFGDGEKYHQTYEQVGGQTLDGSIVQDVVCHAMADLEVKYNATDWQHKFPPMKDILTGIAVTGGLPANEIDMLLRVIAHHEMGKISAENETVLRALATSHRLGVVSNLWSDKQMWIELFEQRNLIDLFEVLVFSSDGPHIKPSPKIFESAIEKLKLPPSEILFVGDDPDRDIIGASALGMATVLVGNNNGNNLAATPDWAIANLSELV